MMLNPWIMIYTREKINKMASFSPFSLKNCNSIHMAIVKMDNDHWFRLLPMRKASSTFMHWTIEKFWIQPPHLYLLSRRQSNNYPQRKLFQINPKLTSVIEFWKDLPVCYYLFRKLFYGVNFLKPQPTSAISWSLRTFSSWGQGHLFRVTIYIIIKDKLQIRSLSCIYTIFQFDP